jgi:hypothetical protein
MDEGDPSTANNVESASGTAAPNQVFVLRLWRAGSGEWRGRVQHVTSGETRYFRAWPGLVAHLEALLADGTAQTSE